jgi:two-component system sensor histidine kinase VicK
MFIGIFIAVLLSFFLAKAISSPLQSLTYDTQLVASGEFSHDIEVRSSDEIGVLADNFNYMKERLRATLEEVDGEREKLDIILSCMRDAVLAFTADGHILHFNNSAIELFGDSLRTGDLSIEQSFEILDIPLVIEGNSVKLTSPDASAEATKDGFIFRDRTCGARVYDVSFAVIRYVSGKRQSSGCVIIIHDVTSRYELDESRREFVSNVSHELKTPLTSIKAYTETILSDPEMDSETRDYFLGIVLSESDRMHNIVSDLLVLSRLDNKRTNWTVEAFDLKQSIRRLCEVMRGQVNEHRHRITFGCQRGLPPITADKQRIEQVILNILSNAIKYTPDGGKIDIRLTQIPKGFLRIEIADNGVGIPDDDIGHLFERFYRVEKSRTQDAGGTGLGLAIAKELVEAHGGQIFVKSTLGEGTTVTIDLPVECRLDVNEKKSKN